VLAFIRSVIAALFVFAYPYLVYRGIAGGMAWLAPSIFSLFYLRQAFLSKNLPVKLVKAVIAGLFLSGALWLPALMAKLIPVLVQLMLMYVFGRTLFYGAPLIERFMRFDYPVLPEPFKVYARQLTLIWTAFFAFNAIVCTVLAIGGSDIGWAFYNGVMIYVLTAALVVGEYIYRPFRFPDREIPSPGAMLRNMIVNGRSIWTDVYGQK